MTKLLQRVTVQNCDRKLLQVWQVLQSAGGITRYNRKLLQSVTVITKCDKKLLQSVTDNLRAKTET